MTARHSLSAGCCVVGAPSTAGRGPRCRRFCEPTTSGPQLDHSVTCRSPLSSPDLLPVWRNVVLPRCGASNAIGLHAYLAVHMVQMPGAWRAARSNLGGVRGWAVGKLLLRLVSRKLLLNTPWLEDFAEHSLSD